MGLLKCEEAETDVGALPGCPVGVKITAGVCNPGSAFIPDCCRAVASALPALVS